MRPLRTGPCELGPCGFESRRGMILPERGRSLKNPKEGKLDETKKCRIWAQGATDQVGHRNYLAELLPHMKACTDQGFELEFKTMTPSVTTVHALSEFRFSREVVRNAIAAE